MLECYARWWGKELLRPTHFLEKYWKDEVGPRSFIRFLLTISLTVLHLARLSLEENTITEHRKQYLRS